MRVLVRSSLAVVCLALASARPLDAQLSDIAVRLHTGLAMPFGAFNGFYDPGVSVAVDVP